MAAATADRGKVGENAMGLDSGLFTRGGMEKDRGESMVELHKKRIQAEREEVAMLRMAELMPHLGNAIRILALRETDYDVEEAARMLENFQKEHEEQLREIAKRRKQVEKEAAQAERDQKGSDSDASTSGSGSDSGSDSGDDRRDKKSKKSKKGKKERRGKDKKSKRKGKDKGKDKDKKKKKDKGDGKGLTAGDTYGKYGIIRETDASAKSSEFILWALEHKKVDVETLPKGDERELFKDYIEDFNTGTLPHEKYYNLEAYERKKMAKAMKKGGEAAAQAAMKRARGALELDDEEQLRKQRAEELAKAREARLMEAYQELKYSDKAKDMKEQELLRLQMQQAYKVGDHATANRLMALLAPEDPSKPGK